jgi:hypothetical protein
VRQQQVLVEQLLCHQQMGRQQAALFKSQRETASEKQEMVEVL